MVHGTFVPHPGRLIMNSLKTYLPQPEFHELQRRGHYPWIEQTAAGPFFVLLLEGLARHKTGPATLVMAAPRQASAASMEKGDAFELAELFSVMSSSRA
jgi:hypothetical protein